MRFEQKWQGVRLSDGFRFDARVPGNIQSDYARAQNWGDVSYGLNFQKFKALEDDAWLYETRAQYHLEPGERLYFVSLGIDYRFDILIDGEIVFSQEGMFTPVALDLTDKLAPGDLLAVKIHPHPKRARRSSRRPPAGGSMLKTAGLLWLGLASAGHSLRLMGRDLPGNPNQRLYPGCGAVL